MSSDHTHPATEPGHHTNPNPDNPPAADPTVALTEPATAPTDTQPGLGTQSADPAAVASYVVLAHPGHPSVVALDPIRELITNILGPDHPSEAITISLTDPCGLVNITDWSECSHWHHSTGYCNAAPAAVINRHNGLGWAPACIDHTPTAVNTRPLVAQLVAIPGLDVEQLLDTLANPVLATWLHINRTGNVPRRVAMALTAAAKALGADPRVIGAHQ